MRSLPNGSVDEAGVPTGVDCEYGRGSGDRGGIGDGGCTSTTRYLRSLPNGSVDEARVPTGAD